MTCHNSDFKCVEMLHKCVITVSPPGHKRQNHTHIHIHTHNRIRTIAYTHTLSLSHIDTKEDFIITVTPSNSVQTVRQADQSHFDAHFV